MLPRSSGLASILPAPARGVSIPSPAAMTQNLESTWSRDMRPSPHHADPNLFLRLPRVLFGSCTPRRVCVCAITLESNCGFLALLLRHDID
ncbi:hypothetical protein LX36DRAFT_284152 [Colletotrichum falcatum]|nr:hypothetical protein LX36DRAFT_284152 [Colletotrichum falcatum]